MIETRVCQHQVAKAEVESRVCYGQRHVEPTRRPIWKYVVEKREQRVEQEEDAEEDEGGPNLPRLEELERPAERNPDRPSEREEVEAAPALEVRHGENAGVEQRDVCEQPDLVVHAGREQQRRQKPADESEDSHGQRVQTHRQQYCCRRHYHHQHEG